MQSPIKYKVKNRKPTLCISNSNTYRHGASCFQVRVPIFTHNFQRLPLHRLILQCPRTDHPRRCCNSHHQSQRYNITISLAASCLAISPHVSLASLTLQFASCSFGHCTTIYYPVSTIPHATTHPSLHFVSFLSCSLLIFRPPHLNTRQRFLGRSGPAIAAGPLPLKGSVDPSLTF